MGFPLLEKVMGRSRINSKVQAKIIQESVCEARRFGAYAGKPLPGLSFRHKIFFAWQAAHLGKWVCQEVWEMQHVSAVVLRVRI
jgi:hypothetical protein